MFDYSAYFTKVPRALIRQLQRDPLTLAAAMVILERTQWAPQTVLPGRYAMRLEVGQAYLGRDEFAASLATSEGKARTCLKRLRAIQFMTSQATNHGTIVTVLGFVETNDPRASGQPATRSETAQHLRGANDQRADPKTTTSQIRDPKQEDQRSGDQGEREAATPIQVPGRGWSPSDSEANQEAVSKAVARGCDVQVAFDSYVAKHAHDAHDAGWRSWLNREHPTGPRAQRGALQVGDDMIRAAQAREARESVFDVVDRATERIEVLEGPPSPVDAPLSPEERLSALAVARELGKTLGVRLGP